MNKRAVLLFACCSYDAELRASQWVQTLFDANYYSTQIEITRKRYKVEP